MKSSASGMKGIGSSDDHPEIGPLEIAVIENRHSPYQDTTGLRYLQRPAGCCFYCGAFLSGPSGTVGVVSHGFGFGGNCDWVAW